MSLHREFGKHEITAVCDYCKRVVITINYIDQLAAAIAEAQDALAEHDCEEQEHV